MARTKAPTSGTKKATTKAKKPARSATTKKPAKKAATKKPAKPAKPAKGRDMGARTPLVPDKDGVVRLSGGNPQVAKGDGPAFVQTYLDGVRGWQQDVVRRLDALIVKTVPLVKKAVRWNSPFYGIEGAGYFLSLHTFTKFQRVTFFRGAELSPKPAGTSKHEDVRYYDIYEGALDEPLFASWVKQASALPGWDPSQPA